MYSFIIQVYVRQIHFDFCIPSLYFAITYFHVDFVALILYKIKRSLYHMSDAFREFVIDLVVAQFLNLLLGLYGKVVVGRTPLI